MCRTGWIPSSPGSTGADGSLRIVSRQYSRDPRPDEPFTNGKRAFAYSRKLEHLARYVARPPVATERLSLTESGHVRYALKTPYRDGTTHVIFEPETLLPDLPRWCRSPRAPGPAIRRVRAGGTPTGPGLSATQNWVWQ